MADEEMTAEELAVARGDYIEPESETAEAEDKAEDTVKPAAEPVQAETDTDDDEDGESPKPIMLPKARYDAAIARAREAERRLAEFEASKPVAEPEPDEKTPDIESELSAIEEKFAEALDDGRTADAAKLMAQQRVLLQQQMDQRLAENQLDPNALLDTTRQELQFDAMLARVEAARPETDPSEDNESYDEAVVGQINRLLNSFIATGTPKLQALEEALNYVYPEGWDNITQKGSQKAAAPKKKTDIEKNLEAANTQPPDMRDGEDSDTAGIVQEIDPMKLSDKDFESMDVETKKRLRGDYI